MYPREVEEVLYPCTEVEECAVIGGPDPEWREKVTAFIVPKDGESIDPEVLKSFLLIGFPPFKVPKEYLFGIVGDKF